MTLGLTPGSPLAVVQSAKRHAAAVQRAIIEAEQPVGGDVTLEIIELQTLGERPTEKAAPSRGKARGREWQRGLQIKAAVSQMALGVSPRVRGLVLLNLVMLACASTFVVLKTGQKNVDPFVFSSLRFLLAALFFCPFWRRALQDKLLVRGGLEIGMWAAGGYLTQSVGLVTADASRVAFLSGFTVIIVPVIAHVFGNTRLKPRTWLAVAAALCGVLMLENSGAEASMGDVWGIASAVLFALQIYRAEHWAKVCGGGTSFALPMMSVALLAMAAMALAATAAAHPQQALLFLRFPSQLDRALATADLPWKEILYMGFGVTNLGLWMEMIALQDVSSTEAAVTYTLEPVVGAALAYVYLGERWGPSGWVGAVLIVASCLAIQMNGADTGGVPAARAENAEHDHADD